MNDYEIKRVIDLIGRMRAPYLTRLPFAEPDHNWNIVSQLIQSTLAGDPVTITALIQASGASYGTASRAVHRLIDAGHIVEVTRPKRRGVTLRPSADLLKRFSDYATDVKMELARILGQDGFVHEDEYFFGGEHQRQALQERHIIHLKAIADVEKLRFLLHHDYFFLSIKHLWSDFRRPIGPATHFDTAERTQLYARIVENGKARVSAYDVVSVSATALADLAARGLLLPLDDLIGRDKIEPGRFDAQVWRGGEWSGRQWAVPAYSSVELLAARRDLLADKGLPMPDRFDAVVAAARRLHDPARDIYGIAWAGARGMPIARSFISLMAHCGTPIFDAGGGRGGVPPEIFDRDRVAAALDTAAAQQALGFLRRLLPYSTRDALTAAPGDVLQNFMHGRAAFAYLQSVEATRLEIDIRSVVKRKVAYLPPPTRRGAPMPLPLDGFLFAIPANIDRERIDAARRLMVWISSPAAVDARAREGLPISPLFSLQGDPESRRLSPIYASIQRLARRDLLRMSRRPPHPASRQAQTILGEAIHDALSGAKSDSAAFADAKARIGALPVR